MKLQQFTTSFGKKYLTACAIVRDEPDLTEWVAYHFAIGFEHIYIYDNESVIPVAKTLRNWINDGKVSVEFIAGRKQQCRCYSAHLKMTDSKWIAFIDADEYILPHLADDLKAVLQQYESFGGLTATWKVFGSDGHSVRPPGLVIESYTKTSKCCINVSPESRSCWPQYKTIAQPEFAISFPNPHFARYRSGSYAVNESRRRMPCWHSHGRSSLKTIQLNHYFVKSLEDFRAKQNRRGPNSDRARTTEEWQHVEKLCNIQPDTRIQRFVPTVRGLMMYYV